MAERDDVTELSEDSLFDNAIDPPAAEPAPTAAPEPAEKPQVEQAKPDTEAAAAPVADKPKVDDDAPMVPSWRLKEITEERRAAQAERDAFKQQRDQLAFEQQEFRRRLAQLEKPPEQPQEPDPLLNPREYREFMERRFEERLTNERREMSLQLAKRTYKEEFEQAYGIANKLAQEGRADPALTARMQHSTDPGETLISWFRDLKWKHEFGNDPVAYRKKVGDEMLKDPEFRKRAMEAWRTEAQGNQSGERPMLAPSLNGISRSAAALRASQADLSDDALWDSTLT
jgi:hypothetical protein